MTKIDICANLNYIQSSNYNTAKITFTKLKRVCFSYTYTRLFTELFSCLYFYPDRNVSLFLFTVIVLVFLYCKYVVIDINEI